MVGQYRRLSEHELEQILGDSEGQGSLECCSQFMESQRIGHDLAAEQQQKSFWVLLTGLISSSAKDKKDVGVSDLGLQEWKSKWGWKSKCLLNKCWAMQAQQDTERNSKTDIAWFLPVYSPSSCYCRPLNNAELEVLTPLVVESPPILSFLHVWVPPRPRFYEFRDYVILQYLLLKKVGMQVSPHSSNLCFSRVDCTVIYDDSSLSGTGLLSHFFQAVKGKVKGSS